MKLLRTTFSYFFSTEGVDDQQLAVWLDFFFYVKMKVSTATAVVAQKSA